MLYCTHILLMITLLRNGIIIIFMSAFLCLHELDSSFSIQQLAVYWCFWNFFLMRFNWLKLATTTAASTFLSLFSFFFTKCVILVHLNLSIIHNLHHMSQFIFFILICYSWFLVHGSLSFSLSVPYQHYTFCGSISLTMIYIFP